ncbi:PLAT/LH2 domain-containing protein [Floridanema aerugineum]|uniref:PLAT/LH2 domain-containing protein n=1 Tax=Floridaenema aerugineum BLCC-F46 TaxID=3153654 RepID=A0ABV4XFV1_9CYAN
MPIYNVTIKTGDVGGAGTDADVRIQLFGDLGETDSSGYLLDKSGYDDFERGDQDTYQVRTDKELGNIEKVRLWHNNAGSGAGWYVDWIKVEISGFTWNFPAYRWLATDEDDRKIDVTFPVATGIPIPFIKDERTEYVRISRKDEIFDNLGNEQPLKKEFSFKTTYSNEVRYESTNTTENSIGVTTSVSVPIKAISLGIEATASLKNTLESKYGKTDSTVREVSETKPIEVNPRQILIVSGILTQETRVGTITRGDRSFPFQVPVGEPQYREARFSYTKGSPAPDDAAEMEIILKRAGRTIPW